MKADAVDPGSVAAYRAALACLGRTIAEREAERAAEPEPTRRVTREGFVELRGKYALWLYNQGYLDQEEPPKGSGDAVRRRLADWLARYRMGKATKGLYLWGLPGRGKTRALQLACEAFEGCQLVTMEELRAWYFERGWRWQALRRPEAVEIGAEWRAPFLAVDDLATEEEALDFGERVEIAGKLMEAREEAYNRCGALTLFSGNLPPEKVMEAYDTRFASRWEPVVEELEVRGIDWRAGR